MCLMIPWDAGPGAYLALEASKLDIRPLRRFYDVVEESLLKVYLSM